MGISRKLTFLLLLASPAFCADIPSNAEIEVLSDFTGGLNTSVASHKIANNFSPALRNVLIDEKTGTVVKRNGYESIASTPTLLSGEFGFTFNKEDGTKEYLVSDSSIVLTTDDWANFIKIQSTLTTTVNLQADQVRNKVWFTNGIDDVFTWDGTQKQILTFVPKGKYIAFYHERVWMFNQSSNGSALRWSAIASTDGIVLSPDDSRAWPETNQLNIGQGDGQVGTGLIVYGGQLRALKDNSIYTIFGNNDTSYTARKTDSQTGTVSQDSLVTQDGLVFGLGENEVYAFDGADSKRLSDLIEPDVETFKRETSRIQESVWDTQSEFGQGNFHGSTATADGFVSQFSTQGFNIQASSFSNFNTLTVQLTNASTSFGDAKVNFRETIDISVSESSSILTNRHFRGYVTSVRAGISGGTGGGVHPVARLSVRNSRTGVEHSTSFAVGLVDQYNEVFFSSQSPVFEGFDLVKDSMVVKVELTNGDGLNTVDIAKTNWIWRLRQATTVQYTSEISTFTPFTFWDRFDAEYTTNQGAADFYIRGSNILATVATQTWQSHTPGNVIPLAPSTTYFQWASTLTAISTTTYPILDSVTIRRIEGTGSVTRAFGTTWKNRYWLAVSTESTGEFPLIYVKAKISNPNPSAWAVFDGHPIKSFFKDGEDVLYAGSSREGKFYRLDFGTNDDGKTITAYYDTPDMTLGDNFFDKKLHELYVDVDEDTNANLTVRISTNNGPFGSFTKTLDGDDRRIVSFKRLPSFGNTFRFRLENAELDKQFAIHALGVVYIPERVRAER